MFKVKNLVTIVLLVLAVDLVYQVFTKSFTNQGGDFQRWAEESEAGVRELEASFAKSRAASQSLPTTQSPPMDSSEDSLADSSTLEAKPSQSDSFRFPKASCGDKPTGGNDTWFPVFVDGGDLDTIRHQFCADAVGTVRKDTKVRTVQLASFTSRDKASDFAKAVGGDVGEPTVDQASSNDEPSPPRRVEVNPIQRTTLETQIQQQQETIQATNLCYEKYAASSKSLNKLNKDVYESTAQYEDNFVTDFTKELVGTMDELGKVELQECLAKTQQQR